MQQAVQANRLEVQAGDYFSHYQGALEDSYWPGVEGNKMIPLEYMSAPQARQIIQQIGTGQVFGLELNPNLKREWFETLDRVVRHQVKRDK